MTLNVLINKYGDPNWKRQCGDGFHKQKYVWKPIANDKPNKTEMNAHKYGFCFSFTHCSKYYYFTK